MEPAGFNEAKHRILYLVSKLGEVTAMDISIITGKTPENSSMLLLNYHRQGLLSRRKLEGKTRGYSIRDRGLERLEWLEEEE